MAGLPTAILCPYCRMNIELTGVKPGRFSPRCPGCHEKFVLIISQDPARPPEVLAIKTSSQTHVLPAMRNGDEEQTTLEDPNHDVAAQASRAPAAPAAQAPGAVAPTVPPAAAVTSPRAERRDPNRPRLTPALSEITGPPQRDDSVFAAKRGKYADWDDDPAPAPAPDVTRSPREPRIEPEPAAETASHTSAPPVAADAGPQPERPASGEGELTGMLGGYEIRHKLGAGGMGAVYVARQVSLDRDVALKVLLPQYATDPQFVARFTREAYAAAQLTHHNVVQIHDIGADRSTRQDIHYFSMELVEGQTLADLVRNDGPQDPEVAVGYILQAARGLKFAHDHGMIHRDIKPENLLLNRQGLVKVADLGLVKTPASTETAPPPGAERGRPRASRLSARVTEASAVFGTPAFMAPEQCEDATRVDHRADIYSLGCTLYHLLTGNPPFSGRTAMEVMTKQISEPVVPPDSLNRHVPAELSAIVMRMMAKRPQERYRDLGEVIRDLEAFLGVESHGPFTPRQEHVAVLEESIEQFYAAPAARLRSTLVAAFFAACLIGVVTAGLAGSLRWASGFVGLATMTTLCGFVLSGIGQKSYLFGKVKQVALTMPAKEWLKGILGILLLVAAIVILGWHWIWLGAAVLSIVLALLFHGMVEGPLRRQRNVPLRRVEEMLKMMRLRGLEEGAIRQFVCKYAGERWEEFYEALFGYEAKMEARQRWGRGDRGLSRRRYAAWRDPIIRWADEAERQRKAERNRMHIQAVEVKALEASGMDMVEARRQGKRRAQRIVEAAEAARESALRHADTLAPGVPPPQARLLRAIVTEEEPPEVGRVRRDHEMYITRRYGGPLDILLGATMRFALAAVLLAGFLAWRYQNRDWERLTQPSEEVASAQRVDAVEMAKGKISSAIAIYKEAQERPGLQQRLNLPLVPEMIEMLVSSWAAGVAGLILLISIFFRGRLFALTVLTAAAIAILGPYFTLSDVDAAVRQHLADQMNQAQELIQQANLTATTLSMATAAALFIFAVIFLRDREPA